MENILDIIRALTISHLLIFGLLFLKSYRREAAAWSTAFFIFCLIGYTAADFFSWPIAEFNFQFIVLLVAFSLPFSFWITSKAYFDDEFQFKKWMGALLLTLLSILVLLRFLIIPQIGENATLLSVVKMFPHTTSMVFLLLGVIEAARNYSGDLVVTRHRFRLIFMISTSIIMILTILTEITFEHQVPLMLDLVQKSTILGLIIYFTIDLLEFKGEFFGKKIKEALPSQSEQQEVDPELVNQLMTLMDDQKIYQTEGLTIRTLSEKMAVKEYKLRQAINQHLGFRNFNEFLNSYRIEDAKMILSQKENKQMTILEIAYQLGYASLAPFNKAFKKVTSMTPTEYRRKAQY